MSREHVRFGDGGPPFAAGHGDDPLPSPGDPSELPSACLEPGKGGGMKGGRKGWKEKENAEGKKEGKKGGVV